MIISSNVFHNISHSAAAQTIAIIGGGFSGTLVAVHLLRLATAPVKIHLIERRAAIGQGVAYSTPFDCHLLNVPASKMSAFQDEPNHFLRWAQQEFKHSSIAHPPAAWAKLASQSVQNTESNRSNLLVADPPSVFSACETRSATVPITAQTFVSRQLYGKYLQAILAAAVMNAPVWVEWEPIVDEAISVNSNHAQAAITLSSGRVIQADRVVLALGNFPPGNPPIADPAFYQSRRYASSAWSRQTHSLAQSQVQPQFQLEADSSHDSSC